VKKEYYGAGKLLISGEYLVLEGVPALALPTKLGQRITVINTVSSQLHWKSYTHLDSCWLDCCFSFPLANNTPKNDVEKTLLNILTTAQTLNPSFLEETNGIAVETFLDFPQNWGLGSSSTLIACIAQWANVNAYELLDKSFGGSGYDIAVAIHKTSLVYSKGDHYSPTIKPLNLPWDFKDQLFFVYLNKKQKSSASISSYFNKNTTNKENKLQISSITEQLASCTSLSQFESLITDHEQIISQIINQQTVKEKLFPDYPFAIKSLGAWGGDFILVVGKEKNHSYFKQKGYNTILLFSEMIA